MQQLAVLQLGALCGGSASLLEAALKVAPVLVLLLQQAPDGLVVVVCVNGRQGVGVLLELIVVVTVVLPRPTPA